jgi:DNA-binding NtrC family response regulator
MGERLLLVEDDALLRAVLAEVFTGEDYQVRLTETPAAAVAALAGEPFDVVITDSLSSHWDATLPLLRQLQLAAPQVPIVLYTGYPEATQLNVQQEGLAAVWEKPMDLKRVLSSLRLVLDEALAPGGSADGSAVASHTATCVACVPV